MPLQLCAMACCFRLTVERRGVALPTNEADLSPSSTSLHGSPKTRPRDRSNRLLGDLQRTEKRRSSQRGSQRQAQYSSGHARIIREEGSSRQYRVVEIATLFRPHEFPGGIVRPKVTKTVGLTKFLPDIRMRLAKPPEREMHEDTAQGQ